MGPQILKEDVTLLSQYNNLNLYGVQSELLGPVLDVRASALFNPLNPGPGLQVKDEGACKIESPRDSRRLFGLSQATTSVF